MMVKRSARALIRSVMALHFAMAGPVVAQELSPQERQCVERGWRATTVGVADLDRRVLWQGPRGSWSRGAILVLHGGSGRHFQFCVANVGFLEPQVAFTRLALDSGFAVFLLDSSDRPRDNEDRPCGKVWDDEVRTRPNLDLPFIDRVAAQLIPSVRPAGANPALFIAGLSSGGFMTVRAATHFDDRFTAFAAVSAGDPYGWHRVCEKGMTSRTDVHGVGYDNETRQIVSQPGACRAGAYPKEKPWDRGSGRVKPTFRLFHHANDGILDVSCTEKLQTQLLRHGFAEEPAVRLDGGTRGLASHLWQDAYNTPMIEFFSRRR